MNAEFFDAVADIEKEKGIPREYMYEKIRQAMLTAFRKDTPDCEDNVEVILDEDKKKIEMVVKKTVVARVIDPYVEISEEAAHRISKRAKIGDVVSVPVETKQFGRIAAQAAKQVIIQGIREAERGMIYEEFNSKEHEILTGVVNKIDPRTGCAFLKISSNSDYTEAMLAPAECIRGEVLHEGDRIKVYVVEVRNSTRGPQVLISRTHPGDTRDEAETAAARVAAPPGTSDHQTGLGADIVDQYYSSLSVDTVNARFLSWLADNCADYGFVIRYPSDKVSITGRNEPWHVRYVGDAAARFMTEHNLCLEEFVALYQ